MLQHKTYTHQTVQVKCYALSQKYPDLIQVDCIQTQKLMSLVPLHG